MEGKAKSPDIFGRSVSKRANLSLLSEETLLRLKRLTFKKLVTHMANFFYKKATLLVVFKKFDNKPTLEMPRIKVECKFLNPSNTEQINSLNNLARERIAEFFSNGARCLGVYYNEKLVGYTWCHYKDHEFPFFDFWLEVDQGVYMGPDFVADEVRGNRIHGFLITKMFEFLYNEGYEYAWGSVLNNNYASIKGLISVGFKVRKKIKVIRVLKRIVYKNIKIVK